MRKEKLEPLWVVGYFRVRRHSRVLYIPLDPEVVAIHDIQKGDVVKAYLVSILKQPRGKTEEPEEG